MITPDWVVKNHHVGYWGEHEMTAFDQAWGVTKYRKLPHCPYCKSNLNLSEGVDGKKRCQTCRQTVNPFYKYPGGY